MITKHNISTEQTILKAAEEVFLSKGFAMAKTVDIAKLAGVNQALLHYYFRTKENLFEAIFSQKIRHVAAAMYEILGREDVPLLEKIKMQIETQFDFLLENPKLPFLVISEIARVPQRIEGLKAAVGTHVQIFEKVQEELDKAYMEGKIRKTTAPNLLLNIISQNIFFFVIHPIFQTVTNMS
ncbi:MAG: TetR/AcrR family transcriptional regulator, partial [Prevotellaceae bacterium]|nr:TetR/AcrR family transcriptional regulator [Prevotellaceae bacterium]